MKNLVVTDVSSVPGSAALLVETDGHAMLYDTGFGFCAPQMVQAVQKQLQGRALDAIVLTHSHYDHALGTPYVKRIWPNATVYAGAYAATIFAKPTARARMAEMDAFAAKSHGIDEYEDLSEALCVDVPLHEGDAFTLGQHTFTALELPGHTKCSVGFFCEEEGLFLSCESLGVKTAPGSGVMPVLLTGYQAGIDSTKRVQKMHPKAAVIPHFGLLEGEDCENFFARSIEEAEALRAFVLARHSAGESDEAIVEKVRERLFVGYVREIYPEKAFYVNTRIMVPLIIKEANA